MNNQHLPLKMFGGKQTFLNRNRMNSLNSGTGCFKDRRQLFYFLLSSSFSLVELPHFFSSLPTLWSCNGAPFVLPLSFHMNRRPRSVKNEPAIFFKCHSHTTKSCVLPIIITDKFWFRLYVTDGLPTQFMFL